LEAFSFIKELRSSCRPGFRAGFVVDLAGGREPEAALLFHVEQFRFFRQPNSYSKSNPPNPKNSKPPGFKNKVVGFEVSPLGATRLNVSLDLADVREVVTLE